MTIAGIHDIRCAASASAELADYVELCGVVRTGSYADEVSMLNGCRLHTETLSFKTGTAPSVWRDAKAFSFVDADGVAHSIKGDEDDYPVVTWRQENNDGTDPRYQVTVTLKL